MRTESNISTTIGDAKISYSFKVNEMEEFRMRGIEEGSFLGFFNGTNILYAVNNDILSNKDKSILCDALVRNGFVTVSNQLSFSEEIYNEDFDRV
jgi:hypothetical protein